MASQNSSHDHVSQCWRIKSSARRFKQKHGNLLQADTHSPHRKEAQEWVATEVSWFRSIYLLWTCSLFMCHSLIGFFSPSNNFKTHLVLPLLFFLFLPISCNLWHMKDKDYFLVAFCFPTRPEFLWLASIVTSIFLPFFHSILCLPNPVSNSSQYHVYLISCD